MIGVVEVFVVALEAKWQTADYPRRKFRATATPLLLGVALDKSLEDVATNQRQRLLLQVRRLAVEVESLLLDFGLRILRPLYTPQRIEGV